MLTSTPEQYDKITYNGEFAAIFKKLEKTVYVIDDGVRCYLLRWDTSIASWLLYDPHTVVKQRVVKRINNLDLFLNQASDMWMILEISRHSAGIVAAGELGALAGDVAGDQTA